MSKSYEWYIFGRPVHAYLSDYKGEQGYERGWHGRFSVYVDEASRRTLSIEYHAPSSHYGVAFKASHGDSPISASFNVGLFGFYANAEHPLLSKARNAIIRAWPLKGQMSKYSGREFSLRFHDHAVFWNLGADDMGWDSKTPKWRDGAWHPIGHNMRQGEPKVLEEREVLVPMPERSYKARARLERTRWGFSKLPRYFDRTDYHVNLDMLEGEQIPFPGKGENGWDCDEDATFSMYTPARTIEEGVGKLVASVLRSRMRYGGPNWRPELKKSKTVDTPPEASSQR